MESAFYDLTFRVLLYPEDSQWVAHALELDILGYGTTEDQALQDLVGNVKAQVSFAFQQQDDSLIEFPAPPEFFQRWEDAQRSAIRQAINPDKSTQVRTRARFIKFNKAELQNLRHCRFTEESCAQTTEARRSY